MPTIKAGDLNLEYFVEGSGPPLLLIMGFGGSAKDWGEPFRSNGDRVLRPLAGRALSYLEIGVYEARSMVWMLDNILVHPGSRAVGVDYKVRPNGWSNLERHAGKFTIYEGWSEVIVPCLSERFDIVYIDGDHSARGALFDTVTAWPRLCAARAS